MVGYTVFSFKTFSIAHSTCLSLRGPLLGFTSSPQGRLSSPCITPLSHQPRPAERNIPPPPPFFFFFSCYYFISLLLCSALKSQLWGVSQHNNEPRRYLCFNWLCRRSAPGSRPKQFIHSEFLARPCYFTPLFWKRNGLIHHRRTRRKYCLFSLSTASWRVFHSSTWIYHTWII